MKRKLFVGLALFTVLFGLVACKQSTGDATGNDKAGTVKAKDPSYKVEHHQQNVDDEGKYTLVKADSETKAGKAGSKTAATAKTYEGFTAKTFDQQTIKADGSTVVKIYYNRNTITLTLDLNNGTGIKTTVEGKFGAKVSVATPTKAGYSFAGWNPSLPETFPAKDTSYKAVWIAGNETAYKVEHHQQNIDNDKYTIVEADTETKTGTTNSETKAEAKTYEGFTAQTFDQQTIKADGSTVVKISYNRNTISLTLDLDGGTGINTTVEGKFGAKVSVATPTKAGYNFAGWNPSLPETFPAKPEASYKAQWAKEGDYTITYHLNGGTNPSDNPASYNVETETITLKNPSRAGYTFAGWFDNESCTGTAITQIAKGSTGNKEFWAKWAIEDDYTIKYNLNDGTNHADNPTSYNVETETITLKDPSRAGYTFAGWFDNESCTGTAVTEIKTGSTGNKEFWAKWDANTDTKYTVEHYKQNIDNDKYTIVEADTETKTGTTNSETKAEAKTYEGFTAQTFDQQTIKADGSTVVKISYNRNTITLTLDLDGGTGINGTITGKFGAKVSVATPTKVGYNFAGWTPELPETFPAKPEASYKAKWTEKPKVKLTIAGDERIDITTPNIEIVEGKKWSEKKVDIESKVKLTSDWNNGDYGIYEWRVGDENGKKITDDYEFTTDTTVYAVTNYIKFSISWSSVKGYAGKPPRGKIIIPNETVDIYDRSFQDCSELTSIELPSQLSKIGGYAFKGCTNLISVELPDHIALEQIGESAFEGCTNLTNFDFTACTKLFYIGSSAFKTCSSLTSLDLSNTKLTWREGTSNIFCDCTALKEVKFPATLTNIGQWTFDGCSSITYVDLSACTQLTSIDGFRGCTGLTSIDLSACTQLTEIKMFAFEDCTNLTSVDLTACTKLTNIGLTGTSLSSAFAGCTNLTSVDLTACTKLTNIGSNTFKDCSSLVSLDLSNTKLTKIPDGVNDSSALFAGCTALKEVKLPATLTSIGKFAFKDCSSLVSLDLSNTTLTSIGKFAFKDCSSLVSLDLSNTKLTEIPDGVNGSSALFDGCESLSEVNLPTTLTRIGEDAFNRCCGLTSVDLSACTKLTTIGSYAFSDCTDAVITLPESITEIGESAFRGMGLYSHCEKVKIKGGEDFDYIKQLVIDSGFLENKIEEY